MYTVVEDKEGERRNGFVARVQSWRYAYIREHGGPTYHKSATSECHPRKRGESMRERECERVVWRRVRGARELKPIHGSTMEDLGKVNSFEFQSTRCHIKLIQTSVYLTMKQISPLHLDKTLVICLSHKVYS